MIHVTDVTLWTVLRFGSFTACTKVAFSYWKKGTQSSISQPQEKKKVTNWQKRCQDTHMSHCFPKCKYLRQLLLWNLTVVYYCKNRTALSRRVGNEIPRDIWIISRSYMDLAVQLHNILLFPAPTVLFYSVYRWHRGLMNSLEYFL